ncbi:MAG: DUF3499 domain-containing protein [Actinomycetia bacterium]|nr:DUF3499 domain-containing protein [Actinomycetes bacterium]
MTLVRKCSRTACQHHAVATLTYVYSDSTAVVGPLATYAEPHTYDLCTDHADRLTPPRGWDIVRLELDGDGQITAPSRARRLGDELSAIVDAVREEAGPQGRVEPRSDRRRSDRPAESAGWQAGASRGHLRAVRFVSDD